MKNQTPLKIVLLSPKGPLYRHQKGLFRKDLRAAPITLTTLASLIPENLNYTLKIYDEGVENIPEYFEADLVGITVITGTSTRSYELASKYRKEGKFVVLGGPHITLMPEEALRHADTIVTGYAEETWPHLLVDFINGTTNERYDMGKDFSFHKLKTIPFPKRNLLKRNKYATTSTFEATRGCVHNCDFCVVPSAWGRRPFQKPISYVIDDIRQHGSKKILFYDLNLIADKSYAKELFRALIPLKVKWFGLSTTLLLEDQELLDLTSESGCVGILFGFDSVTDAGLDNINKAWNRPLLYSRLVQEVRKRGISIMGTFMFGGDGDKIYSFDDVKEFVFENRIELPRYAIITPFPNTPLYHKFDSQNRIITKDWTLYDGQHVVFRPKNMTVEELYEGNERVWRETYSYKSITKRIGRKMPNFHTILAANLGYRYYANNLSRFYTCKGGLVA